MGAEGSKPLEAKATEAGPSGPSTSANSNKSRARELDDALGFNRPAIKRGASLSNKVNRLQADLSDNQKEIQTITDSKGTRAKLSAAQEQLVNAKKQVQSLRASGAYGTMEFNLKQDRFKKLQADVEKLRRQVQKEDMKSDMRNKREAGTSRTALGKRTGAAKKLRNNKVQPSQPEVPQWRVNVANAKSNFKQNWRMFAMLKGPAEAALAAGQKAGQFMHLEDLSTQGISVYQGLGERADAFINLGKQFALKQAQAAELLSQHRADKLAPIKQENPVGDVLVGPQWLWRQDRVPLCTPMLVMGVDDLGNKAVNQESTSGEKSSEASTSALTGLDNEDKLERWCKECEEHAEKGVSLQDIGNTMQMMMNRANSHFLQNSHLAAPAIHDIEAFAHAGGLELKAYEADVKDMVTEGRFAFQVHAAEFMALYPNGDTTTMLHMEPWTACEQAAPNQVPACERLTGLSFFRRVMIRMCLAVKTLGGHPGLTGTVIILHLRDSDVATTVGELVENSYFGFSKSNIFLVPAREGQGFVWNEEMHMFTLDENSVSTTGGDGYSMQQLMVPYDCLTFLPGGRTEKQRTTVLSTLQEKKVQWMHSFHLDDMKALMKGGTLDVTAFAMAIKEQKTHGANIGVEVSEVKTVTDMQYRGSVLIKPPVAAGQAKGATGAMLCKVHECLSPHVVADLERLRKRSRGRLMVGTNRYFFYVPHLAAMLQERTLFRVTLEMAGASVYPRRFMQDLTSADHAYCFAMRSRTQLPASVVRPFWWGKEAFQVLKQMDQEPSVRAMVGTYIKDMSAVLQPADTGDRYDQYKKKMKDQPRIIVFFVTDNAASHKAFDLVANWMQSTISSRDHWHIVTSVRNAHNEEAAKDLLDSFYDETLGGLNTTRTVLVRGEQKLHEVMSDYALKVKARLLVFGSSSLSAGSNMRRLGSVTLTALKALSLPILVVKDDTKRTDLKKYFASERNKFRACVHVTPTAGRLVEYVGSLLDYKHRKDIMILARPDSLDDQKGDQKTSSKFVLDHFNNVVREMNLHPVTKALLGHPHEALPVAAEGVEAHILAVQAPNNRTLPEWIAKTLHSTKCAILVYKDNHIQLGGV